MANIVITTTRKQRILSIFLVGLLYVVLQVSSGVRISAQVSVSPLFWVFYASYAVSGLLFYGIGSLCWLYAYGKQHTVASLLFGFTTCMMITFSSLSASAAGDGLFLALSAASTALAILCFFLLLLYFPYAIEATLARRPRTLLRLVRLAITVLCAFTIIRDISVFSFHYNEPGWWVPVGPAYYLLTAIAIIVVIVHATRRATTVREQQQSRFFFLGTLLSFVPILGLTVLPTLLHLHFVVDGTLSVIFLVLFPFTMGYAVLRYSLLVFDSYVKRAVTAIVSAVGLALLTFVLFAIGSVLISNTTSFSLAGLLLVGVLGAPCIWWGGKLLTEHFFFPEAQYYKRVLRQVQQNRAEQSFDLQQVAHLLVIDTMTTLNTPGVCVFVLDEETYAYTLLAPPSHEAERTERVRALLLSQVNECLSSSLQQDQHIDGDLALIQQLQATQRPLFWSEVAHTCEEKHSDRATRSVLTAGRQERHSGPLFAPLRSPQGEVIGIILISERGDEQRYGGPDLEAMVQLLHLSALPMETARQFHITMREQERAAHEREEAYEQQRQLNEMKDRLIIHMSHELRTPLSEVSGYLELMKDFGDALDSEHRATFLMKATHGCDELLILLQQILDSTQSNASTASLKMEDVMLASLLTQEVSHLNPTQSQSHTFAFQVDESLSAWADEQSVRQIVRNVLSNAVKYSPEHSTVTVGGAVDNTSVLLFVRNEGEGISSREMPLLFEKFARLERHHSGSIRGTGLGLYICRQLTEAMGGQIWAESSGREGEGTTFFVRFAQAEYRSETRAA